MTDLNNVDNLNKINGINKINNSSSVNDLSNIDNYNFDICVVSFSDLRFDARTINLVETLVSLGKKIVVFSISNSYSKQNSSSKNNLYSIENSTVKDFEAKILRNKNIENIKNFKNIIIDIPHNRRMFLRWISFLSSVKSIIYKFNFRTFWAADLYSLPVCKNLNSKENIKIIYDSREIYSGLSTLANSNFRQKILILIEKYFIKKVSLLVTSGEMDSEYLKNFYNLKIPISEIKNFPKFKEFVKSNLIREHFNIPNDKMILLYQGVLLDGRGLIPIMKAIQSTDKYVLVILGEGNFKFELEKNIKQLKIENKVKFAGNIDYDDLHKWTCSADIGLCNIEPISFSYKLALPNKLFEYILAELPVLVTDLPALKEVINSTNCGFVIPSENTATDILNALDSIVNSLEKYKTNSKNIKNNFIYESQKEKIIQLIKN